MLTAERATAIEGVADRVPDPTTLGRPVLVAVDGMDGAGKTCFADELADVLRTRSRCVVRASVDGFHRPRAERYRRGRDSPLGFWLDSYDYGLLRRELLDGFAAGGDRRYRTAVHDVTLDAPVHQPRLRAPDDAVLLLDGIFLHRDELVGCWDLSVYLHADDGVRFSRMADRDGTPPEPTDPANARYLEGQRLYVAACDPRRRAGLVVDNTDLRRPTLQPRVNPR